ncbi:tetratricopeptide repeat protein [Deinococcus sp. KSM4-11]|uniref:tetratricopeptide repeat protein n=1 Tax=Deinococcus sp. KSM4-11 TaxID=2568654 RepID=UPI0010A2F4E8|nr:tetratricopeptide repeat protein [Deinococcus sp. KSM4-11]THF87705.1 tetratricopeptide repeat protein [Deinococcus sp. KSM4-11]
MRSEEQAVMRALHSRRQGAVLAYHGPAGVGKTHAAHDLLRRAGTRAHTLPATLPLADWPARLPPARALPGWAEAALRRLPDGDGALGALATLIAANAPVGVVVDDLHDATPAQASALLTLAELLGRARGVALLFTTRHTVPEGLAACAVEPLGAEATAALCAEELGPALPPEVCAWVHGRARGNPLFTLEYVRFLVRSGHLYSDGQRWHWRAPDEARLPGRIEALIDLTLERAGQHRAIMDARACVPDAPQDVWAHVANLSPEALEAGIHDLRQQGLLSGEHGTFSHPLYAEVLRAQVTPDLARTLARRALEAYRDDPLRAVAFLDAAQTPPAEAATLLERAAEEAQGRGLHAQAGALLARASDLTTPERRAVLAGQAAGLLQGSDLPRALELATLALREPTLAAQMLPLAATLSARTGGRAALDTLLDVQPPGVMVEGARILALQNIGDHTGALTRWEALNAAGQAAASVAVRSAVAMALLGTGRRHDAARELSALLAGPLSEPERQRLLGVQVMLLFHQGEYRAAADQAAETARAMQGTGNEVGASALWHNRAAFLRMLGELEEAMDSVRRALDARRRLGDARGTASSLGMLAELHLERGELDRAEDALSEAQGSLTYLDGAHFLLNNLGMLTSLYTLSDAPLSGELALHHARRALRLAGELDNPRLLVETLADASRAYARAGQGARALELAEQAQQRAATLSADPRTLSRNGVARGLALDALGRREEALAALEAAEATAREHLGDYEANRVALESARLQGDRGRLETLARQFEERGQGLGALLARRALGSPLAPAGEVRLRVLGPLELDGVAVRGELRRALLLRLLEARLQGRAEVTRLDLADDLYPGRPEAQALGALKQGVAALRAAAGHAVILTTPGGYALGEVPSDAAAFLARPALGLWRGPLPPETGEALREALHAALLREARAALDDDPAASARAARLVWEEDTLDEAALALTLEGLRRSGNHRSLSRLYSAAREQLAAVGVALPERWQEYLGAQTA